MHPEHDVTLSAGIASSPDQIAIRHLFRHIERLAASSGDNSHQAASPGREQLAPPLEQLPSAAADAADATVTLAALAAAHAMAAYIERAEPDRQRPRPSRPSLLAFVGHPPTACQLRNDLDRFTFLLGGNDGEPLFQPGPLSALRLPSPGPSHYSR